MTLNVLQLLAQTHTQLHVLANLRDVWPKFADSVMARSKQNFAKLWANIADTDYEASFDLSKVAWISFLLKFSFPYSPNQ